MDSLPKPYFQLGGATLYKGDCRELLPLLPRDSVDLIVTDPPYGMNWQGRRRRRQEQFAVLQGDDGSLDIVEALRLCLVPLKRRRHLYVFGLSDWADLKVCAQAEIIWDKGIVGLGDLSSSWGPQHETIAFASSEYSQANIAKGDGKLLARLRHGSILRCDRKNSGAVNRHPTEKPVPILRQMIESSSLVGETVLDPFAGVGSTLVASLIEGRKAIGIEIDEKFCSVAAERIEEVAAWAAMMPK